eukprot:1159077-Pelagomonas_calceolata.AAC.1
MEPGAHGANEACHMAHMKHAHGGWHTEPVRTSTRAALGASVLQCAGCAVCPNVSPQLAKYANAAMPTGARAGRFWQ